jgi:hypothetical protein
MARGDLRLGTTLRESVNVLSATPVAIAPAPSGPSVVSVAALGVD